MLEQTPEEVTLILDIGKTHCKIIIFDDSGIVVETIIISSPVQHCENYRAIDVEGIWNWFESALFKVSRRWKIAAINVTTHGACFVLLDEAGSLICPVMDYEDTVFNQVNQSYALQRDDYQSTFSPLLPDGLNAGKQLMWLHEHFPDVASRIYRIVFLPQFFVWKLTGHYVSELTSLGCHTDLWLVAKMRFSEFARKYQVPQQLPPIKDCTESIGHPTNALCEKYNLLRDCRVFPGVHDSNAGLVPFLHDASIGPFSFVSTGTWFIIMSCEPNRPAMVENRDMLANLNVLGNPVYCSRFMGGRDYETICNLTGADPAERIAEADLQYLIDNKQFALPTFVQGTGPWPSALAKLPQSTSKGHALATLYLALMVDAALTLLETQYAIIMDSINNKNPILCQILAQLRPQQPVFTSNESASTAFGAWALTRWNTRGPARLSLEKVKPTHLSGLKAYKEKWLEQIK